MTRINRGAALIAALLVTPALVAAATNVAVGADGGRSDDNDQGGGSLPLIQRAAAGPVDVQGGAAREDGDQTQLIRDSLRTGKVKNVILLIGDGMGDSEITVARNYLKGAGGFFAGIDALPLTGQYDALQREPYDGPPGLHAGLGRDRHRLVHRREDLRQRGVRRPPRHGVPDDPPAGQGHRAARPATSPPPRSRTRPRPSRSPTSPPAPATDRTSRRSPAPRRPRRTAAWARSASSSSTPAPTSRSAAVRRRSPRTPRPAPGPASASRTRRSPAATSTSPPRATSPASPPPTRPSRCWVSSRPATCP